MRSRSLPVSEVMSTALVTVSARDEVAVAERVAIDVGVHHLLVVRKGEFVGLTCLCDLTGSDPEARVEDCMHSVVVAVDARCSVARAARLMTQNGIGIVPVLEPQGGVLGVVTRRDLRRVGALPNLRGVDRCAACGTSHDLEPFEEDSSVVFCKPCLDVARPVAPSLDVITLGGEG